MANIAFNYLKLKGEPKEMRVLADELISASDQWAELLVERLQGVGVEAKIDKFRLPFSSQISFLEEGSEGSIAIEFETRYSADMELISAIGTSPLFSSVFFEWNEETDDDIYTHEWQNGVLVSSGVSQWGEEEDDDIG